MNIYDSAHFPHEYLQWIMRPTDNRFGGENELSSGRLTGKLLGGNVALKFEIYIV